MDPPIATRAAHDATTMPVTELTGTMLAHLHAMGYDAVGSTITVPTIVLVEVLRMPS